MRNSVKTSISGGVVAAVLAGALAMGATSANAGVTGCSAPGGKQEVGAVIGALAGGLIGNKVGGRERGLETVVGAGVGAAAGSAIGCEMQKDRAERQGVYTRNGYRLSAQIAPASYNRLDRTYVATTGVNLRAGPTTNSAKVGRLQPGQRFEALAKVRGSDWILVGQNGVGVGYVRDDFVRPDGRRYAGR